MLFCTGCRRPPLQVSVDVRSSSAGKVISVSAAAGDVLKVGAEIMKLDTESAADTDTAEDAVETNSPHGIIHIHRKY